MKSLYQLSTDTNVEKGFVKIIEVSGVKVNLGKKWYLPHQPVINSKKPGKVRRVCNAASNYKECVSETCET